jgi:hypothetical protein
MCSCHYNRGPRQLVPRLTIDPQMGDKRVNCNLATPCLVLHFVTGIKTGLRQLALSTALEAKLAKTEYVTPVDASVGDMHRKHCREGMILSPMMVEYGQTLKEAREERPGCTSH